MSASEKLKDIADYEAPRSSLKIYERTPVREAWNSLGERSTIPMEKRMNESLAKILERKQKQAAGQKINWDERRDKFIAAVDHLYRQIQEMLGEAIANKKVSVQRRAKDLSENYIGTYKIDDLIVLMGDEQVRFSPRGRNVGNFAGRVDVLGERGEASLLVQTDGRWGFVQTRQPTLKVVPLDESSFAEVLELVMRE